MAILRDFPRHCYLGGTEIQCDFQCPTTEILCQFSKVVKCFRHFFPKWRKHGFKVRVLYYIYSIPCALDEDDGELNDGDEGAAHVEAEVTSDVGQQLHHTLQIYPIYVYRYIIIFMYLYTAVGIYINTNYDDIQKY